MNRLILRILFACLCITLLSSGLYAQGEQPTCEDIPADEQRSQLTDEGLKYVVLRECDGPNPTLASTVTVHYSGRLMDGTVFDSSYERGTPATFPLNNVIAGWQGGLQLMSVGAHYRLIIPPDLGYGEAGAGDVIPGNAILIFDVELLEIDGVGVADAEVLPIELFAARDIDENSCPTDITSEFAPDDQIFIATQPVDVAAGTRAFVRLLHEDEAIEETDEIVAPSDLRTCVFFVFKNDEGWEAGDYSAELYFDGELVGRVAFEV
ncbi:MAG: FKBP-type peptidyl-prolyl cis-trans isomerase [Chloroflexota bacterium]|nr:FKBP-type peptidyl-prolyl cis-trans isomerase [Chloroflexota bacterium]